MAGPPFVRRAGSGRLPDGRRLTWTVADGSRGRRWRSTTVDAEGRIALALLVEVSLDGALSKLEAASPAGLLTLHPEGSTLHGNRVHADGIEHLALPFSAGSLVLVDAAPAAAAVAATRLAGSLAVGAGTDVDGVAVADDLRLRPARVRVDRVGERAWRFAPVAGGHAVPVRLDDDGVPVLDEAASWPLELAEDAHG